MASLRPLQSHHLKNDRYGRHEEVRYHGRQYIKKKIEFNEPQRFGGVNLSIIVKGGRKSDKEKKLGSYLFCRFVGF